MRKVIQVTTLYACKRCKTKYTNKKEALKCDVKPIEKKVFRIGDAVKVTSPHYCSQLGKNYHKKYFVKGIIVKIFGPQPADFDFEILHLGGKSERLKSHVFQYEVKFTCPYCKFVFREVYYAPQLKK